MYFNPDGIGFDAMPVKKSERTKDNSSANRVNLKGFMLQHGQSIGNADRAMKLFDPFFTLASAGSYPFHPAVMTKRDSQEVLSRLLGKPIAAVVPIPLAQFATEINLFAEESLQDRMASDLGYYSECYSLYEMIGFYFAAGGKISFARRVGHVLDATLWGDLLEAIRVSTKSAEEKLGYPLHWGGLRAMLYYYICFALIGGPKAEPILARLEPGIHTLGGGIIILGRLGREPGTCLLLGG